VCVCVTDSAPETAMLGRAIVRKYTPRAQGSHASVASAPHVTVAKNPFRSRSDRTLVLHKCKHRRAWRRRRAPIDMLSAHACNVRGLRRLRPCSNTPGHHCHYYARFVRTFFTRVPKVSHPTPGSTHTSPHYSNTPCEHARTLLHRWLCEHC